MLHAVRRSNLDELEDLLAEQAREVARRSLLGFVKYTRTFYRANWHHQRICRLLDEALARRKNRIIVQAPPRHGKSELASRALPAMWLGKYPDSQVISACYSADLASLMNRDVQRIMESKEYRELFPETRLNDANVRTIVGAWLRNAQEFEVVGRRGAYYCAGVGGGATGRGADLFIIDDPTKNLEEAHSITHREKVWGWYQSVAQTRLQGHNNVVVLILTRWHEDDLAGRLLAQGRESPDADQWEVLNLPAIKEDAANEIDPREPGEALWPTEKDAPRLRKIKASVTPIVWNALYQGRPSAPEGGIFKRQWWRFWYPAELQREPAPVTVRLEDGRHFVCVQKPLPKLKSFGQSWDMAFKDTKGSAFVVGQVWGYDGANDYLLDQVRQRKDFVASVAAVKALDKRWPGCAEKLIEEKANGAGVLNVLGDTISGLLPVNPEGSKEARAHAASHYAHAGNVWLPHPSFAPWVKDLIEETATFPNSTFKDQVDSISQWLIYRHGDGSSLLERMTKM